MRLSTALTWLATFGLLGATFAFVYSRSRSFAANPLAGPRMRRLTRLYVPLLQIAILLFLGGIALIARSRVGTEPALATGPAQVLLGLVVACAVGIALTVGIQGFTLSERLKRRGEAKEAARFAARGFGALLAGLGGLLVAMFAALLLSNPGGP